MLNQKKHILAVTLSSILSVSANADVNDTSLTIFNDSSSSLYPAFLSDAMSGETPQADSQRGWVGGNESRQYLPGDDYLSSSAVNINEGDTIKEFGVLVNGSTYVSCQSNLEFSGEKIFTYDGKSCTETIPEEVNITVEPEVGNTPILLEDGTTQYVIKSDNELDQKVTWSIDKNAQDAGFSIDENGKLNKPDIKRTQEVTVTAILEDGNSDHHTVTVVSTLDIAGIVVEPKGGNTPVLLDNGATQYVAMLETDYGQLPLTQLSGVQWSTDNADFSIDNNGLLTKPDIDGVRKVTVTAALGEKTGNDNVMVVSELNISGVTVEPQSGDTPVLLENGTTQYVAMLETDYGPLPAAQFPGLQWNIDDGAESADFSIDDSGLLTKPDIDGIQEVTVTAALENGTSDSDTVMVVSDLNISGVIIEPEGGDTPVLLENGTTQYTAMLETDYGQLPPTQLSEIRWSLDDTAKDADFSINERGLLTKPDIDTTQQITVTASLANGKSDDDSVMVISTLDILDMTVEPEGGDIPVLLDNGETQYAAALETNYGSLSVTGFSGLNWNVDSAAQDAGFKINERGVLTKPDIKGVQEVTVTGSLANGESDIDTVKVSSAVGAYKLKTKLMFYKGDGGDKIEPYGNLQFSQSWGGYSTTFFDKPLEGNITSVDPDSYVSTSENLVVLPEEQETSDINLAGELREKDDSSGDDTYFRSSENRANITYKGILEQNYGAQGVCNTGYIELPKSGDNQDMRACLQLSMEKIELNN
ncbi:hypothetical protein [Psychromonas aquimarina]|uniref:hypothetical protein n=1 Tax=Psychromonas aquimarina TaxID=444919 RepID=UPI0004064B42|nr:hypothetical protein [Psychromonas aquimarina]